MKTYQVHIGYTRTGRDKWRTFDTLAEAFLFVRKVFERSRIVLSITTTGQKGKVRI